MKFLNKFQKFMYGRYGPDDLYKFLVKLHLFLFILNLVLKNDIIIMLELVVIFIAFYRFFSKKIYIRSNENQKFLKLKKQFVAPFHNIKRNIKDKDHIYKKCRKCKTTLKLPLPSKRGIKHAKCPHCKNRVTLFTFKKEKIEIITNNKKVKYN